MSREGQRPTGVIRERLDRQFTRFSNSRLCPCLTLALFGDPVATSVKDRPFRLVESMFFETSAGWTYAHITCSHHHGVPQRPGFPLQTAAGHTVQRSKPCRRCRSIISSPFKTFRLQFSQVGRRSNSDGTTERSAGECSCPLPMSMFYPAWPIQSIDSIEIQGRAHTIWLLSNRLHRSNPCLFCSGSAPFVHLVHPY